MFKTLDFLNFLIKKQNFRSFFDSNICCSLKIKTLLTGSFIFYFKYAFYIFCKILKLHQRLETPWINKMHQHLPILGQHFNLLCTNSKLVDAFERGAELVLQQSRPISVASLPSGDIIAHLRVVYFPPRLTSSLTSCGVFSTCPALMKLDSWSN